MTTKMKKILTFILPLFILFGCEHSFNNPIDPDSEEILRTPTNLRIELGQNHEQFTIYWEDNTTYHEDFEISVKIDDGNYNVEAISHEPAYSVVVNSLDTTKNYTYMVRAMSNNKFSEFSEETFLDWRSIYPSVPNNLILRINSEDDATLSWEPNSDFTELYVIECKSGANPFNEVATTNQTSYRITNLNTFDQGTQYFFRVRAKFGSIITSAPTDIKTIAFNEYSYSKKHHFEMDAPITSIAFSNDDEHFAVGSFNGDVGAFSTTNGVLVWLQNHSASKIAKVIANPNLNNFASASDDGSIMLWDFMSVTNIWENVVALGESINDVCYNNSGSLIAATTNNQTTIFNNSNSNKIFDIEHSTDKDIKSIDINNDSHRLLLGLIDGGIEMWDIDNSNQLYNDKFGAGIINVVQFSPTIDNQFFAVSDSHVNNIQLWDNDDDDDFGPAQWTNTLGSLPINLARYNDNGNIIASASISRLGFFQSKTGINISTNLYVPIVNMKFIEDTKLLFVNENGGIKVMQAIGNNEILWENVTYLSQTTTSAVSSDNHFLAIGTNDGIIEVYEKMGWYIAN